MKASEVSGSILVVPDGKGHCLVGLVRYFRLKFILVLPTVCEELVWALGAASGSCHDLGDHLVSSLLLQMRNQGQESRQDLIKVALDPGSLVTKQ